MRTSNTGTLEVKLGACELPNEDTHTGPLEVELGACELSNEDALNPWKWS